MRKFIFVASVLMILLLLFSCYAEEEKQTLADNGSATGVKMTALVKNIGEKIEVEVIEGEYGASGIFWVNVSDETVYVDKNNYIISASDLEIGDIVEITYGGQVMMSYPPQIVASIIRIK